MERKNQELNFFCQALFRKTSCDARDTGVVSKGHTPLFERFQSQSVSRGLFAIQSARQWLLAPAVAKRLPQSYISLVGQPLFGGKFL